MNFPALDNVLWLTGFVLNVILLTCLQMRKPRRGCFCFAMWVGLNVCETLTLFVAYRLNRPHLYATVFWTGAFLDCAAQAAVLLELAQSVLTRNRCWVGRTKRAFALLLASSMFLSIVMASTVKPAASTQLDSVFARCNLFLTILVCLTFTGIVFFSSRYGLSWAVQAQRIGFGLGFWIAFSFVTDTLHAYWRFMPYYDGLEIIRTVSFQLVLIYWIVFFSKAATGEHSRVMSAESEHLVIHS